MCGLCSEFDGEELREFRGLDRCLYRDPVDFAYSNLVQREGRCDVRQPRGERICEDPKFKPWTPRHNVPQSRDGMYLIIKIAPLFSKMYYGQNWNKFSLLKRDIASFIILLGNKK